MKRNTIGVTSFLTMALLFVLLSGCDKKSTNYGLNVIYMPTSAVSGGLNLNYTVPAGLDSATYNFTKDSITNKVTVFLGVLVSGQKASHGFTVNVSVNKDTTNQIIASGSIANAMLLPDNLYTLPASVTVPANTNQASFALQINDYNALKTACKGKMALLTVVVSNPTFYSLNNLTNKTVVIIDVNKLTGIRPYHTF